MPSDVVGFRTPFACPLLCGFAALREAFPCLLSSSRKAAKNAKPPGQGVPICLAHSCFNAAPVTAIPIAPGDTNRAGSNAFQSDIPPSSHPVRKPQIPLSFMPLGRGAVGKTSRAVQVRPPAGCLAPFAGSGTLPKVPFPSEKCLLPGPHASCLTPQVCPRCLNPSPMRAVSSFSTFSTIPRDSFSCQRDPKPGPETGFP